MSVIVRYISNKSVWKEFHLSTSFPSIFQSWSMGEALIKTGEEVDRIGFYSKEKLVGVAQIINVHAKRGSFIHIRGGPSFNNWLVFKECFSHIRNFAKERKVSFIRMSPPILKTQVNIVHMIKKQGFIDTPIPLLDAESSWVLPLDASENDLLMGMRKTTRYLIRKAQKNGVVIKKTNTQQAINELLRLYKIMTKEKGIVAHKGISEEFFEFTKDSEGLIIEGYYNSKLLGSALILFYGSEGIYHHSAHLREEKEAPVSYLMQWEAILETKRRGKKYYNFWGLEPTGNKKHPWYGLSLFKMGFGGELRSFMRAVDYPLSPSYKLTWLIETARRIKRYRTL